MEKQYSSLKWQKEKNQNKWSDILCFRVKLVHILKMAVLPRPMSKIRAIAIKIQFIGTWGTYSKIYMKKISQQMAKPISKDGEKESYSMKNNQLGMFLVQN